MCCAGGSALGSAAIYDEMMRYHRVGKPIVVSMGNYATSGGYYIAGQQRSLLLSLSDIEVQPLSYVQRSSKAFGHTILIV